MPLNSSGPISIGGSTSGQSINLELGRSATATSNLNENALRTLAGKASGIIALSDFYGKSNATVTLNSTYSVSAINSNSAPADMTAVARFTLESDGDIIQTLYEGFGYFDTDLGDWVSPKTAAPGSYQVRATQTGTGGTLTGDVSGSWINLSTTRTWELQAGQGASGERTLSIDIGLGGTVLDSTTVTISATGGN